MITTWDVRTAMKNLNVTPIPFDERLNDSADGYSEGRELAIKPGSRHPVFTTLHELGHILLGHTRIPSFLSSPQLTAQFEVEAQSVALALTNRLELEPGIDWDPALERRYVSTFWGRVPDFQPDQARIVWAAKQILHAGQRVPTYATV